MADQTSIEEKRQTLASLREQVAALEAELATQGAPDEWATGEFYTGFYVTVGFLLGGFAAMASLVFNVVCAPIAGKHPLELIKVYLTFPLGDRAMKLTSEQGSGLVIADGVILALGCCLYILTGMVLGAVFHWGIARFALTKSVMARLAWGTVLAIGVWLVNFYLILAWLQPALFGGNWITDNAELPWWVACSTHLIFGWTMALLAPYGKFIPYQRPTEQAH